MTGADAPALRALAGQMSQSAAQLERTRQNIRSRLYSINWHGQDGATFRQAWDHTHGPLLTKVAEGLRSSADRLLREAAQQEQASGAGGGALGAGGGANGRLPGGVPGDFELGPLQNLLTALGVAAGGAEHALEFLNNYAEKVPGHWRGGQWIDEYWRWSKGHADDMNRLFGKATDRMDDLAKVSKFGKFIDGLNIVVTGVDQWQDDAGKYGDGERAARAAGAGLFSFAVGKGAEWGAMEAGGAIGFAVGGPVGAVVGVGAGFVVANVVTNIPAVNDAVQHAGAAAGSAVWDAGSYVVTHADDAVDFGRNTIKAGGEVLDHAGDSAKKAWKGITSWRP